jgi:hypothetical protein
MDFQAHAQGILVTNEGVCLLVTKDRIFRQWSNNVVSQAGQVSEPTIPSNEWMSLPEEKEMLAVADHMLGPKVASGRKAGNVDPNSAWQRVSAGLFSFLKEKGSVQKLEVIAALQQAFPDIKPNTVASYASQIKGVRRDWGQWSLPSE